MSDTFPHIPLISTIQKMPLQMVQQYSQFYELPIAQRPLQQLRDNLSAMRYIMQGDVNQVTTLERQQLFKDWNLEGDTATLDIEGMLVVLINHIFAMVMRYNAIGYCLNEHSVDQVGLAAVAFTGSGTCDIQVEVEDNRP